MSLSVGARLGPYEIIAPLGAGGMGEVYRARDQRLNRTVAIKILSDESSTDPDRRERFEREARAISALDHPNICALYDVGEHDGTYFLVMPCLEGETLADRLTKGAVPPDQAIKHAIEIATALDAAHRHGIIHRDLKPGNVMLTKTGAKLLDFGLAKLKKAPGPMSNTTIASGTGIGTLLGTMPYMSPEQIEGRDVDARSDIFSLGAVIYEMLTGKRAFKGDTPASVIGSIMKDEPSPISALQPLAPAALDHVVTTCLAKDPDDRWQSASDIAQQLKWIARQGPESRTQTGTPRSSSVWRAAIVVLAVAGIVAAIALPGRRATPESLPLRFTITPPAGNVFTPSRASLPVPEFKLSSDSRHLVFVGGPSLDDGGLWIRSFNELTPRLLPGTKGAADPFWSPDNDAIAFFASGRLKTIALTTGEVRDLCAATRTPRGGSWSPGGVIVFGGDTGTGLSKVSVATGIVEPATQGTDKSSSHRWPQFLSDGRRFIYYARGDEAYRGVYVASLDGGEPKRIMESMFNGIAVPGYLLTVREGALLAYPFDEQQATVTGEPFQITNHVVGTSTQRGAFDATGELLVMGESVTQLHRLSWFNREGHETPIDVAPASISSFRLSADGSRLVYSRVEPTLNTADIWIADLERNTSSRLTTDPANDFSPVFSPDARRIVFRSDRTGRNLLFGKASTGGPDELVSPYEAANPTDWSPDGRYVMFHQTLANTNTNIAVTTLDAEANKYVVHTDFDEYHGRFAANGKWFAYTSDESGRSEVYVQPFFPDGSKWTVSSAGGGEPLWRRDGRELFYVAADGYLMAVPVTTDTGFTAGVPRRLFRSPLRPSNNPFLMGIDTYGDGQRFLIKSPVDSPATATLTVVAHWLSGVGRSTK